MESMEKNICSDCNKEFQSVESLNQHRQAKHTPQPAATASKGKGIFSKKIIAVAVVLLLIVGGYLVFAGKGNKGNNSIDEDFGAFSPDASFDEKAFAAKIPKGAIHWHPHVTILIKGKQETIPANLGLSGSIHQPVHTHATDNILHWEVNSPTVDNMQLGYFFNKVWKKKFGNQCFFDYCNGPDGTLKMFVNGAENSEFEHYMPKDKDEIKIVFE